MTEDHPSENWSVTFGDDRIELTSRGGNVLVRRCVLNQILGLTDRAMAYSPGDIPLNELHSWLSKPRPSDVQADRHEKLKLFQQGAASAVMDYLTRSNLVPLINTFTWDPIRKARMTDRLAELQHTKRGGVDGPDILESRHRVEAEFLEWVEGQFPERSTYSLARILRATRLDEVAMPMSLNEMAEDLWVHTLDSGHAVDGREVSVVVDGECRTVDEYLFPLEVILTYFAELGLFPGSVTRPLSQPNGPARADRRAELAQ